MGFTTKGETTHLTRHSADSLCGRYTITRYVSNRDSGMPVPFQEHWVDDRFCPKCLKELDRILRPLLYEKRQKRLI